MNIKPSSHLKTLVAASVLGAAISSNASAYYFQDNSEGYATGTKLAGSMAATTSGITWRDSTSAQVSNLVDRENKSGGKSLQFFYKGNTDINIDAWAEQRVDLQGQFPELWIAFDILVPANYYNRGAGSDGGENDKVMIVYNDFTGNTTMVDFENFTYSGLGSCYLNAQYKVNNTNIGFAGTYSSPVKDTYNLFGKNYKFIDQTVDAGKWLHLVFHVKLATSSTASDGVTQVWKNGQKILENLNVPNFNSSYNHFSGLYLMGWANTGYTQDTYFYIDNFTVSDQPLSTSSSTSTTLAPPNPVTGIQVAPVKQ